MTTPENQHDPLWDDALDAIVHHIEQGLSPDQAVGKVAESLDALFAFDRLLPGKAGELVERHDGRVFQGIIDRVEAIVAKLKELLKRDPVKRAERQAKRAKRREERKERRANRRDPVWHLSRAVALLEDDGGEELATMKVREIILGLGAK